MLVFVYLHCILLCVVARLIGDLCYGKVTKVSACTFAVNHIGNLQELKLITELCVFLRSFWLRPHYAGEISKRCLISTVMSTVHTNPSQKPSFSKTLFKPKKFENTALFRRLGLLSTLMRHENEAFRKVNALQTGGI